jgi:hypothetical protein
MHGTDTTRVKHDKKREQREEEMSSCISPALNQQITHLQVPKRFFISPLESEQQQTAWKLRGLAHPSEHIVISGSDY